MNCLDTYALIEVHNGNEKFSRFLTEDAIITDLTMTEFYGWLFKKYNKQTAEFWHRKLSFLCREVPRYILIKAIQFRIEHKKQRMSFFDCVGYMYSQEHNRKFVTGDKEFKNRPGVEFVKKD